MFFCFTGFICLYSSGSRLWFISTWSWTLSRDFCFFLLIHLGVGGFGVVFRCHLLVVGVFPLLGFLFYLACRCACVFIGWCLFCFDFGFLGYH